MLYLQGIRTVMFQLLYGKSSGTQAIFISNMTVLVPNAVGTLLGS